MLAMLRVEASREGDLTASALSLTMCVTIATFLTSLNHILFICKVELILASVSWHGLNELMYVKNLKQCLAHDDD